MLELVLKADVVVDLGEDLLHGGHFIFERVDVVGKGFSDWATAAQVAQGSF